MSNVNPKSLANLRPGAPDGPHNPTGKNGRTAQIAIAKFLEDPSADPTSTRFQKILLAAYTSAIVPGPKGAVDRKTLIEHYAGKPRQGLDLSNEDGSIRPKILEVHWVKPEDEPAPAPPEKDGTGTSGT
jgi:hypothetical protein